MPPPETLIPPSATNQPQGLTSQEVSARLSQFGPNRLVEPSLITFWSVFSEEIREPLILLLLAIAVIYSLVGRLEDVVAIVLIVAAVVLVEVYTEYRAKYAVLAVKHYAPATAAVLRDGGISQVPTEEIVPGDVLLLTAGERVPADARLLEGYGLAADESHLTGESVAADKQASTEAGDEAMVYAGSLIVRGRGWGQVSATGMATKVGKVLGLVIEAKEPKTPLQNSMKQLAGQLMWASLALSALVTVAGIIWGKPWQQMLLTGLTVAFATIPEELPILITMVLGVGAYNLAKRHALVKKLYAAETMGSVTVVATDKTGTLTGNRLSIAAYATPAGQPIADAAQEKSLIELGVRASDVPIVANTDLEHLVGDQTQIAFYRAAANSGENPATIQASAGQLVAEFGFDGERQMLSRLYRDDQGGATLYVAGAPEAMVVHSTLSAVEQQAVGSAVASLAEQGLRVIGLATRQLESIPPQYQRDQLEQQLSLIGMVGLRDQPHPESAPAVQALQAARVRTIMVTGDHPQTAAAIGKAVGITGAAMTGAQLEQMSDTELATAVENTAIFARTSPEEKLRIVKALQGRGEVVAVTGDGVNDAPALRSAEVGIAMGQRGTDLAREAAAVVLLDDNFATIVQAVAEGRRLFANLSKAIAFYLACKLALILLVTIPTLFGATIPFQPIQIVIMELFMDLAASAGFVVEPAEPDLMQQPPRPKDQPLLHPLLPWIATGAITLTLAVGVPFVFAIASGGSTAHVQTIAFTAWLIGAGLLALAMSSLRHSVLKVGLFSNPILALWPILAAITALVSSYLPLFNRALFTTPLNASDWLVILASVLLCTAALEVIKLLRNVPTRSG